MSVLLSNNWLVNKWVSMGFFEDCLKHASKAPRLEADIRFCVEAELDTLDLREKDFDTLAEFRELVAAVIEDNNRSQGRNFAEPELFPFYLAKLTALKDLVDAALTSRAHGGGKP